MLIEFTVENYRSFSDAQTLSMIASKDSSHPQNVVQEGEFRLLKVAALYGANASGKSNFTKAFAFMNRFVGESATKLNLGDPISGIEPFRLDRQWQTKPSTFAIRVLIRGTEYQYGFSATRERVYREWLQLKREGGRVSSALKREYDPVLGTTQWHLRGELREQASAVAKATRDNSLFLSHAAQMNVAFVKELFLWFRRHFWHFDLATFQAMHLLQQSAERLLEDPRFRERMETMIHDADLGIGGVAAQKEPISFQDMPKELRELFSSTGTLEQYAVRTTHAISGSEETVEFSLEHEESLGTQRFFGMVGRMLNALDDGDVLVVDEFDCSMHPLLTQKLIELFQSNEANSTGAQLVFTTHDSSLMSPALFRRDQIWFSEKNDRCASQLFSLCDIEPAPRKGEAFERNYLAGRYGAVPNFGPAMEDYEIR